MSAVNSTCHALLYELRTYGVSQLKDPGCLARLASLSTDQARGLIAVLMRIRGKFPAITDDLIAKLGELL